MNIQQMLRMAKDMSDSPPESALSEEDAQIIADAFGGEITRVRGVPVGLNYDGFNMDLSDAASVARFLEVAKRAGPRVIDLQVEGSIIGSALFGKDPNIDWEERVVTFHNADNSVELHIEPDKARAFWMKLLRLANKD